MNQQERLDPLQAEAELLAMNREQLRAELDETITDLEDLEELRRGFLGKQGCISG